MRVTLPVSREIVNDSRSFRILGEGQLLRVEGAAPHYLIEVSRPGTLDYAAVKVEVRRESFSDEMRQAIALRDRIEHEIHVVTGIRHSRGAHRAAKTRRGAAPGGMTLRARQSWSAGLRSGSGCNPRSFLCPSASR